MKSPIFAVVLLSCLCLHTHADSDTIGDIIASMKNSFTALSTKRDHWYNNYSNMKKLADANQVKLAELLLVSKLAIPMIWNLYADEVATQKREFPKLLTEQIGHKSHYHNTFTLEYPFYHVELTLHLQEKSHFQIELLQGDWKIFLLEIDYENRRAVFSHHNEDYEIIERLVLDGEDFPAITPGQKFRVNIQVADDCIFTSFWTGNFSMKIPRPLPKKHSWCSKIYHQISSHSISVSDIIVLDIPQTPSEAQEKTDDDHSALVQLESITVYEGLLIQ